MDSSESYQLTEEKTTARDGDRIILFDGVCNLCNGSVQFVLKHDRKGQMKFASLQSSAAGKLLAKHAIDPGYLGSIVFLDGDKVYIASDAVLRVSRYLAWPWKALACLRFIPKFIREPVYRWIARNRYQWFGKRDSCMMPDEHTRNRFLDGGEL